MNETKSPRQLAEHLLILADHPDLDAHAEQVLREAADVLIEAERRGAERMRERAAVEAERLWDCIEAEASPFFIANGVRALPLTEETPDDA